MKFLTHVAAFAGGLLLGFFWLVLVLAPALEVNLPADTIPPGSYMCIPLQ